MLPSETDVAESYRLREEAKKIKARQTIVDTRIKESVIPNQSVQVGGYIVSVNKSQRVILDTKRIKADYKNLYDHYGKKQDVITLKITEVN